MNPLDSIERFNRLMAAPAAYMIGIIAYRLLGLVFPIMTRLPKHPARLFIGTVILITAVTVSERRYRRKEARMYIDLFRPYIEESVIYAFTPRTESDFRNLGVQNPLDFCYAMMIRSFRKDIGADNEIVYYSDSKTYDEKSSLCREMFGREPEGASHKDWIRSVIAEVIRISDVPISNIDLDVIRSFVSPECTDKVICLKRWETVLECSIYAHLRDIGENGQI